MSWTALQVTQDLSANETSVKLQPLGKAWRVSMTAHNPDPAQPAQHLPSVTEAACSRLSGLLDANQWVKQTRSQIADLEKNLERQAATAADAERKQEEIDAAKVDPKLLTSPDLAKRLAQLDKEHGAAATIGEQAAAAVRAIEGRLATLRQQLNQARRQLAMQALGELRREMIQEKSAALTTLLDAMAPPLDRLADIEGRLLALGQETVLAGMLDDEATGRPHKEA